MAIKLTHTLYDKRKEIGLELTARLIEKGCQSSQLSKIFSDFIECFFRDPLLSPLNKQ